MLKASKLKESFVPRLVHKCVWNGRLSRQCLLQWFGHFAFSSIVCVSTNQRSSKKSLVIDGSHAISVASFASGDARIARGRLKCMITAHPSFTRVFFQQHANNQEIDTIANCHATFQYQAHADWLGARVYSSYHVALHWIWAHHMSAPIKNMVLLKRGKKPVIESNI